VKRSGHHDESIIRAHLRPAFGAFMLHEISVVHIDKFIVERAHLNKKTVANHLTLLGAMLNVAKEIGWLALVPRIRKPKVRIFSADFSYLRTDEEVRRFLVAASEEARVTFVMCSAAIYTGMRAGELAGLHRGDVSFESRLITVQRSFSGPTKAEDVRYVPILDPLLPLLREHRLAISGRLVFPNEVGEMFDRSARVFQEAFHRVLKRAAFPKIERGGKERHYIRFHDLRHTFASHWVMKGGDLFKLQKILGHKTVQMTMRYAHLAPHPFSEDFRRFGSSSLGRALCRQEL
jgi:integrase